MSEKIKLGAYGGTFNPPHLGHVSAAHAFQKQLSLDKLLIIPDFIPPHKALDFDPGPEMRLEMCRLAFSDIPGTVISDMEINRGGKSYTADTLTELSKLNSELYFLVGTDMFLTLDTWYHPEIIFQKAVICYVRRENDLENEVLIEKKKRLYEKKFGARIVPVLCEAVEISSSEIREAACDPDLRREYLGDAVADYIAEKGIYG